MSAVIKFPGASAPIQQPVSRGCNVDDNRRSGYVLLFKSMKDSPFYKDPSRKALWIHLLIEAVHERTESTFNGNRLTLTRGQVVGSARYLGEACGVSEDSARRSLDAFEREGMITRFSKQGTKGYTLITILNYDPYQRGVSEHIGAELAAELEPASEKGLEGVSQSDCAELPAEFHAEDLNNINNKTNKDLKPFSSKNADALSDAGSDGPVSAPVEKVRPDAAVQTPSGKFWGTQDDLTAAEFIHGKVLVVNPTAKAPNWPQWANEIRLMRELDGRTHHEICSLFKWANLDPFWSANVLCPKTLRKQWDKLTAKRAGVVRQPTRGEEWDLTKTMTAEKLNQLIGEGF